MTGGAIQLLLLDAAIFLRQGCGRGYRVCSALLGTHLLSVSLLFGSVWGARAENRGFGLFGAWCSQARLKHSLLGRKVFPLVFQLNLQLFFQLPFAVLSLAAKKPTYASLIAALALGFSNSLSFSIIERAPVSAANKQTTLDPAAVATYVSCQYCLQANRKATRTAEASATKLLEKTALPLVGPFKWSSVKRQHN